MSTDTHDHSRARARRRPWGYLAGLAAVAVAVTLAACGGGSSSTASSATNSANTATPGNGQRSGRFAALRACLQKEGINLPSTRSGRPPQPGGGGLPGFGGGGLKAPAGVSQSKFQEALKKCGAGRFPGGGRRFSSAAGRAALTKFAQCMRENGVNLPAPNTSGNGPVFNSKGLNPSSSAFKSALTKCRGDLRGAFGAFGRRPGGAPPSTGNGAPPGEGGGGPPGAAQGGGGPPAAEGGA
jgi:hypothetical protein